MPFFDLRLKSRLTYTNCDFSLGFEIVVSISTPIPNYIAIGSNTECNKFIHGRLCPLNFPFTKVGARCGDHLARNGEGTLKKGAAFAQHWSHRQSL